MDKTRERKGYKRGTSQNFLHSFPLSCTGVPQSSSHIGHGLIGSEQKRPGASRPPKFVPESPLQKGVIFSPRSYRKNAHSKSANFEERHSGESYFLQGVSYRENAHSKSANFEERHSGGHLLGRPLLFTSKVMVGPTSDSSAPGLIKHVLTVLVFWSQVPLVPHLPSFIQEPQIVALK